MKLRIRILFVVFSFIALLFICLHLLVNIKGNALLTSKLEQTFKRKVKIGSLVTSFPTTVYVKNIEAEGLFKVDEVIAGGGLFDIFRKSFRLSLLKIIHPVITIRRGFVESTMENFVVPSDVNLKNKTDDKSVLPNLNPMAVTQGKFLSPRFYIDHLIISDGVLNFIDKSIDDKGILIKIENLYMKVDNLNFVNVSSRITNFELKGIIPWQQGQVEGSVDAEGWINLYKKDIQASLNIKNIDGVYLHPYYANWVDLEKSRIQQAKLNFNSEIAGHNNDIIADCHLELTDIVFRPKKEEEPQEKAHKIATAVLDLFKAFNGKIDLNFTIRTKMDRPEFGFDNIRMAVEDKIAKTSKRDKLDTILSIPAKLIENTVKGAVDITRAMIDGTMAVGNEVRKGAEQIFKKEKEGEK